MKRKVHITFREGLFNENSDCLYYKIFFLRNVLTKPKYLQ